MEINHPAAAAAEPGVRTLERRRREDEAAAVGGAASETKDRDRRREMDSAEERAKERLYEPPIIQFGRGDGSGGGSGVGYYPGGVGGHATDRHLKSFSAPQRR